MSDKILVSESNRELSGSDSSDFSSDPSDSDEEDEVSFPVYSRSTLRDLSVPVLRSLARRLLLSRQSTQLKKAVSILDELVSRPLIENRPSSGPTQMDFVLRVGGLFRLGKIPCVIRECTAFLQRFPPVLPCSDLAAADSDSQPLSFPHVVALGYRLKSYRLLEQYDKALADANSQLRLFPPILTDPQHQQQLADTLCIRGVLRGLVNDLEGALSDLDRSIGLRPSASTFVEKGEVLFELGRFSEAYDAYQASMDFLERQMPETLTADTRQQFAAGGRGVVVVKSVLGTARSAYWSGKFQLAVDRFSSLLGHGLESVRRMKECLLYRAVSQCHLGHFASACVDLIRLGADFRKIKAGSSILLNLREEEEENEEREEEGEAKGADHGDSDSDSDAAAAAAHLHPVKSLMNEIAQGFSARLLLAASGLLQRMCSQCSVLSTGILRRCSRCHSARYCSVECQRRHWPTHRAECAKLVPLLRRVESEAEEGAGSSAKGED